LRAAPFALRLISLNSPAQVPHGLTRTNSHHLRLPVDPGLGPGRANGNPLPATPILLAAGALSAEGQLRFPLALAAGLSACLIADTSWFFIGRRYGHHVLRILCKLSMEPTICVRRTQDSFGRRRQLTLLFAKFVPGLATLAAPVAGQNGMKFGEFLFFDSLGALAWVSALLTVGRLFGDALERDPSLLSWVGRFSGLLLVLGILAFFVGRIIRRRMVIKQLVAARLEPSSSKTNSTPASPSISSTCAIPSNSCPTPSPSPEPSASRPRRSQRAISKFPAIATLCFSAPVPVKPQPPKQP